MESHGIMGVVVFNFKQPPLMMKLPLQSEGLCRHVSNTT